MWLAGYIGRVRPKALKKVTIPPITLGETSIQSPIAMDEGFAEELLNCRYVGGNLQIGRGGLTKLTTTALDGEIVSIVKAAVAGVENIYVATATTVYKYSSSTFTAVVTGQTDIEQLLPFNKDLIICASGRTKRYDGTNLFVIGSQKDTITNGTATTVAKVYSGTGFTENWTTANDGVYRRVVQIRLYIKKVASLTGSTTCTLNGVSSDAVDVTVGVSTSYAIVEFEF